MSSNLNKIHLLFLRKSFLFYLPFILIFAIYFITNPFNTLPVSIFPNTISEQSMDIKFTRALINNYKVKGYNTFIFGNSRAGAYQKNYASYFSEASLASLNSPGESIRNIYCKVKLIDSLDIDIKHVLIHMDDALLANVNNTNPTFEGPAYLHHPLTAPSSNWQFQTKGISFFFDGFYFVPYTHYLLTKTYKPYMTKFFKDSYGTNKVGREEMVDSLKESYYKSNASLFPKRKSINVVMEMKIDSVDKIRLNEIATIFKKHKTDVKICFSINYHMRKMSPSVIAEFQVIFGKENVYDFTGKNPVAEDITSFYESSHFRVKAGKCQLDSIFLKKIFNY